MLAAVKTPRTEITIRGEVPPRLLALLREEYGSAFQVEADDGEELTDVFTSQWYREVKAAMTPGDTLRVFRETRGLTQSELGRRLGGLPRQQISNMEHGLRPLTLTMAKKLAAIFQVPAERFLDLR